ncbi:hypothetical protein C4588_01315 [Candidatus Parcubacteria bacterium]|nr:MAG: hypothetical protein C4588_01315 [Candidatus Parcubacteria bacterium]
MEFFKKFFSREKIITILAFLWLFTLMTGYYIIKPLRETFLNELPYQAYPYLLILTMVVIFLVNFLYDLLARSFSSAKLITLVTVFFAILLSLFPFLLNRNWPEVNLPILGLQPGKYIFIVLYNLFVGIYNLFVVTMFWSFVNEIFLVEEARNNFGAVTAGGTLGGLLGSKITTYLSTRMHIGNLLFFSVAFLLITLCFMKLLLPYKKTEETVKTKNTPPVKKKNGFELIRGSTYLQWMLIAMFLTTSTGTMLSHQMNALVKTSIESQAERAIFWANMNFWINGLGFIFQIFLVRFVVCRFGIMTSLLIAPVVDCTGSFLLSNSLQLNFGRFSHVGKYSSEYSFNRASREMLYTPTDRDFKYQAKAVIDTFIFRLGDGITSLLLISLASLPLRYIAFIGLFVNLLRIIPAIALANHYKIMLRTKD